MKKYIVIPCMLVGCGVQKNAGEEATKSSDTATVDATAIAKKAVTDLAGGNVSAVIEKFDDTMKGALPAAKLSEVWQQLLTTNGAYKEQVGVRIEKIQGVTAAFVTVAFEKGKVDVQVTLDNAGNIAGLFIRPPSA